MWSMPADVEGCIGVLVLLASAADILTLACYHGYYSLLCVRQVSMCEQLGFNRLLTTALSTYHSFRSMLTRIFTTFTGQYRNIGYNQ